MSHVTHTKDTKKLHSAPSVEILMVSNRMLGAECLRRINAASAAGERELRMPEPPDTRVRTAGPAAWKLCEASLE